MARKQAWRQCLPRMICGWKDVRFAALIPLSLSGSPSFAERHQLDLGVTSDVTVTNNSTLAATDPQSDLIVSVRPRFLLVAEGSRFKFAGSGSINLIGYAQHTQENRVLPDIDLSATGIVAERAFTIEAGARASQVYQNPFGVRADPTDTQNKVTTTQVRLAPVLDVQSVGGVRLFARSDNSKLDDNVTSPAATAAGYFGHHNILVEQLPRPFGLRANLERFDTRYENTLTDPLITDVARLGINYATDPNTEVGLHVGEERNNFVVGDTTGDVYGMTLKWRPSERTNLSMLVEHRYFGTGGRIEFDHRMPWLAWNFAASRGLITTPQTLFELGPTNDVAALLSQMLTTRFPDPIERSRQVQEVISRTGLPAQLAQSTAVYSQRISLESVANVGVAYLGQLTSLALNVYWSRLEDAPDSGALATGLSANNNAQKGVSLTASRRITPVINVNMSIGYSNIRSLVSAPLDQESDERSLRLSVNFQLTPKSVLFVGARHIQFKQDTVHSKEDAAGIGIDHRF